MSSTLPAIVVTVRRHWLSNHVSYSPSVRTVVNSWLSSMFIPRLKITGAVVWLALSASTVVVLAADAYVSTGFLRFPPQVEVGAMSSVAVDAEDRIFVLHRGEPPLVAFDKDGNYVSSWGQGLFKVPHGLRVDGEGNVWTTDNGNHVLRMFSREGRLLRTLGTAGKPGSGAAGFRAPDDLVFDSKGNIYIADSGNGRIVKLAADGSFLLEWGKKGKESGQFATAHGLAIDKQD